jgi:hypothetical protein
VSQGPHRRPGRPGPARDRQPAPSRRPPAEHEPGPETSDSGQPTAGEPGCEVSPSPRPLAQGAPRAQGVPIRAPGTHVMGTVWARAKRGAKLGKRAHLRQMVFHRPTLRHIEPDCARSSRKSDRF